jgi:DNA repair exonuclease SbcCD ATPase subunit
MRLTRVKIAGFGTLRDAEMSFGPAMNLVVGPNEAGKSTLQEAILTGLYGLGSDRDYRTGVGQRPDRWRPWQNGAFGLTLEFELEDGSRLSLQRDLDAQTLRVIDSETGDDVTNRFAQGNGDTVGRQLLGISREIYSSTACISRSEVMRLEDPGSIREVITSLADSARPDRTAQRVLDRLREERTGRIGKPRSRSGPLHEIETRLRELEKQLADARKARSRVDDLARKREAVAALTDSELSVVRTLEAALAGSRLEEAERRLARVRQLAGAIAEEEATQRQTQQFASFPLERHGEVLELRSHLRATAEVHREFEQQAQDVAEQIHDLDAERRRLESEAVGHESQARGIDDLALKEEPLVRELVSSLSVTDGQAPELQLRAQATEDEVQRLSERHPGLIGPGQDWPTRQMEFQRSYSEWRERQSVAADARKRAGSQLPPRLEQLKHDIARYREVPEVIRAGQHAEEAMRREEAMAERARLRQRAFLGAMLGGLLLATLAILVAFLNLSSGPPGLTAVAFFLLGMGVFSTALGIWVRASASREVDRRLRSKDEARTRRREVLAPWGVRSSAELQQALVEHLQKVRSDATRLELDKQAAELAERSEAAGHNLRELIGSWGLPQPSPSEEELAETSQQIENLAQDTLAWNAATQRAQEASRALAVLDEKREALRQRLHSALDRMGFDKKDAVAAGREFIAACEAARAAQQVRTRIEQLDAQLEQLNISGKRAESERTKADEYRRRLAQVYAPAGISQSDPEAADRAWDQGVTQAEEHARASSRLSELRQQLGQVTGSDEMAAQEQLVNSLNAQLKHVGEEVDQARVAEYRSLPQAELERQRDEHRAAREKAQEERARAEELLNDRLQQIGDVASMEEEIAALRERAEELETQAHAYDLAIETLEAAARSIRRAVVPQLKSQLQAQLAPITNGRYRDVKVNDDMGLQVRSEDQRSYRDVDELSLGTRSLIYLLQRLALARIIGGSAEPVPLLLDEALVHTDRRRMRAALDELGRLGQENQIILFSKDEGLAERAERADNWTIIRLPGPELVQSGVESAQPNGAEREQLEAQEQEVPTA